MDSTIFKRIPMKVDKPEKKKKIIRKTIPLERIDANTEDIGLVDVTNVTTVAPVTLKNYRQFFLWLYRQLQKKPQEELGKVFQDANLLHKFGLGSAGTIGAVATTTAAAAIVASAVGIITIGYLSFRVPLFVTQMVYFILRFIEYTFCQIFSSSTFAISAFSLNDLPK